MSDPVIKPTVDHLPGRRTDLLLPLSMQERQLITAVRALQDRFSQRPTVTGSTGGNAALESLLDALTTLELITDNTTT